MSTQPSTQIRENGAVNGVKRADVLRRNTVKFKAVIRRFIVAYDGISDGRNDRSG
jgi:hypothetical protein